MTRGKATRIWHSETGRAYEAAWSPDARQLAVTIAHGITTMTAAGKDLRRLRRSGRDSGPQWAPDGRMLAFIRRGHVWIVARNGRGLRQLASTADVLTYLWSPDSRSILFTRDRSSGSNEIYAVAVVGSNGLGFRTLTAAPSDFAESWSPDGRKILFTRGAPRAQGAGDQLWSMDADGSGQAQLLVYQPHWSILSADWGP